jgi:hypothetical protein
MITIAAVPILHKTGISIHAVCHHLMVEWVIEIITLIHEIHREIV